MGNGWRRERTKAGQHAKREETGCTFWAAPGSLRIGPEVRLWGLFLEFGWWQGSASISLEQPVHLGRVPEKAPKEIG